MQSPTENSGGAGGMRSELRSDAQQIGSSVSNRLHDEINTRKDGVANQARSVSSALDRVGDDSGADAPQWVRSVLRQGAEQVRSLADTLEQKDSRQIMQSLRTLARDNPGTFLACCATLGFAATRVFKSGGEISPSHAGQVRIPNEQSQVPMYPSPEAADGTPASAGAFA